MQAIRVFRLGDRGETVGREGDRINRNVNWRVRVLERINEVIVSAIPTDGQAAAFARYRDIDESRRNPRDIKRPAELKLGSNTYRLCAYVTNASLREGCENTVYDEGPYCERHAEEMQYASHVQRYFKAIEKHTQLKIKSKVGSGTEGDVYRTNDPELVIKVSTDPAVFYREAASWQLLWPRHYEFVPALKRLFFLRDGQRDIALVAVREEIRDIPYSVAELFLDALERPRNAEAIANRIESQEYHLDASEVDRFFDWLPAHGYSLGDLHVDNVGASQGALVLRDITLEDIDDEEIERLSAEVERVSVR